VITINPDGRIQALNPAGAALLGVEAAPGATPGAPTGATPGAPLGATPGAPLGATLRDILPDDGGADDFMDALLAPVTGEPAPAVVDYTRHGERRRFRLAARAHRLTAGGDSGRLVVTASFTDVTELERLADSEAALAAQLREQHQKLQTAYLELEGSAERLRTNARLLQLARIGATLGVFVLFMGAGLYAWTHARDGLMGSGGAELAAGEDSITLIARPVSARIAVVGALDAGAQVSVVGPFDGLVRERRFRYGGAVERGEVLLRMDTAAVEVTLREARSALIRAQQRVEELRTWANGFEVARARRAVAAAELEAGDLRTRVGASAALLARGIIPAEEHRNLMQQQRNQSLQMQAARQDLEATMARGDAETARIAGFELANAEVKVRDLEADLGAAEIHAPVSGVVLLPPPAEGGRRPETVEVGSRITRGQTMLVIGDLETFQVRAQVDEIDVGKLRIGQAVQVTGDAFSDVTLTGRVASVAAQASAEGNSRTGLPSFGVTIEIGGITAEQRRRLAVGMSASLAIITYDNPAGFVVPPVAVREAGEGRIVRLRHGRDVPVTIGIAQPEGIEIRGELREGDVIVLAQ